MELKTDLSTDSLLVLQIRENNEDAKDYLYTKYSALIYKEIKAFKKRAAMLGVDLEDLTQEAMLGFSNAIMNFNDEAESKFITFATLCIRRQLSNYVAKFDNSKSKLLGDTIALDQTVGEDEKTTLIESIESNSSDPLGTLINSENLLELGEQMLKLSDNEKIVLRYDVEGKTVDEIAKLTGMSNKQIYNLIFRARKKLKI